MKIQVYILLTLSLIVSSKDYDDDEGKPYEFGFTIDGQQHRRESKDVNGIIMGEFGFITADGIYHVTVYATDENGSFKILSMKNIRVSGPLDVPGYEFPSKTAAQNSAQISTTSTTTTTIAPTNFNAPYVFTTLPSLNKPSCGSCKLPSTTPRLPGASNKLPFQTPEFQDKTQRGGNVPQNVPTYNQNPIPNIQTNTPRIDLDNPQGGNNYPGGINVPPKAEDNLEFQDKTQRRGNVPENVPTYNPNPIPNIQTNIPRIELDKPQGGNNYPGGINVPPKAVDNLNLFGIGQLNPRFEPKPSMEQQPPFLNSGNNDLTSNSPYIPQNQNYPVPDQKTNPSNMPSKFPDITVSNNQITIPGKEAIQIKDRYPNMKNGLPDGITENDMLDLLYKFNYTLGFHGHHEKGLKNGAKIGAYFVNGRDGIMRVVEYVADENGYRPKVKFINLGLDSPDTPKEGSEKKFGLKGFEFVWFPV